MPDGMGSFLSWYVICHTNKLFFFVVRTPFFVYNEIIDKHRRVLLGNQPSQRGYRQGIKKTRGR